MIRPRQPAPATGFWTPSAWFLAQTNHVIAAALILLAAAHAHLDTDKTLCWLLLAAAFKEFVLDIYVLEHDSFAGSFTDWRCYAIGAVGGRLADWHVWIGTVLVVGAIVLLTLWDIAEQHTGMPYD